MRKVVSSMTSTIGPEDEVPPECNGLVPEVDEADDETSLDPIDEGDGGGSEEGEDE